MSKPHVTYAVHKREVTPIEQHVHSYLGVLPMMSLTLVVVLNWKQFLALFGFGIPLAPFAADADLTDAQMRALGRHRSARQLPTYAKRTRRQLVTVAQRRRETRTAGNENR